MDEANIHLSLNQPEKALAITNKLIQANPTDQAVRALHQQAYEAAARMRAKANRRRPSSTQYVMAVVFIIRFILSLLRILGVWQTVMTDQSPMTVDQDEPADEMPDSSPAPPEAQQINNPAVLPLEAEENSAWDTVIKWMAYLGAIGILVFLVYIAVVINRVNQWDSVTESFANEALQVRISYPQHVGRDETSKLHVVIENNGQQTFTNLRVGFTSNGIARSKTAKHCLLNFQPGRSVTLPLNIP